MRHILGEDLNVGCVLSWGPCWYYQKQFFEGSVHKLSTPDYLMRYDVEVSGFPSQHAGHLCLLRLRLLLLITVARSFGDAEGAEEREARECEERELQSRRTDGKEECLSHL